MPFFKNRRLKFGKEWKSREGFVILQVQVGCRAWWYLGSKWYFHSHPLAVQLQVPDFMWLMSASNIEITIPKHGNICWPSYSSTSRHEISSSWTAWDSYAPWYKTMVMKTWRAAERTTTRQLFVEHHLAPSKAVPWHCMWEMWRQSIISNQPWDLVQWHSACLTTWNQAIVVCPSW